MRPKRFFECIVPNTQCNLKCEYCYVIQEKRRTLKQACMKYSPERIQAALTVERLGGICYFSICGAGETLLQKDVVEIVKRLLENGHYVNITTNGTVTSRMQELCELPREHRERLQLAVSFHYLELKRLNLLDSFWENLNSIKRSGISFVLQMNLYAGYEAHLEDIKKVCVDKVGALPQLALTRKENSGNVKRDVEIYYEGDKEDYEKLGASFKSKLFDFTMKNFRIKRKEFCYAGEWSGWLNLATGELKKCYQTIQSQNIFENIEKPIRFEPVGNCCRNLYCVNSSHFLTLGVIPDMDTPTYVEVRNREEGNWYGDTMKEFLGHKLQEENKLHSQVGKIYYNILHLCKEVVHAGKKVIIKIIKR